MRELQGLLPAVRRHLPRLCAPGKNYPVDHLRRGRYHRNRNVYRAMKANELMIGDWAKTPKGFYKIISIQDNDVVFTDFRDGIDGSFELNEISPVEITAELLEVNGFEKQGFDGWLLVKRMGDGLAWSILWRTDCPSPCLRIDSYFYQAGCFSSFAISYVHQLQHALRLCGIEKEIALDGISVKEG